MQMAAVVESQMRNSAQPQISCQQLPLSFLKTGARAKVAKVRGKGDVHHHLENLGFVEGADVHVVSEQVGNLIVEVKGAHVALDKSIASKIVTC